MQYKLKSSLRGEGLYHLSFPISRVKPFALSRVCYVFSICRPLKDPVLTFPVPVSAPERCCAEKMMMNDAVSIRGDFLFS